MQVSQSTLFNTSVNITIAFTIVFGECVLDKVCSALRYPAIADRNDDAAAPLYPVCRACLQPSRIKPSVDSWSLRDCL